MDATDFDLSSNEAISDSKAPIEQITARYGAWEQAAGNILHQANVVLKPHDFVRGVLATATPTDLQTVRAAVEWAETMTHNCWLLIREHTQDPHGMFAFEYFQRMWEQDALDGTDPDATVRSLGSLDLPCPSKVGSGQEDVESIALSRVRSRAVIRSAVECVAFQGLTEMFKTLLPLHNTVRLSTIGGCLLVSRIGTRESLEWEDIPNRNVWFGLAMWMSSTNPAIHKKTAQGVTAMLFPWFTPTAQRVFGQPWSVFLETQSKELDVENMGQPLGIAQVSMLVKDAPPCAHAISATSWDFAWKILVSAGMSIDRVADVIGTRPLVERNDARDGDEFKASDTAACSPCSTASGVGPERIQNHYRVTTKRSRGRVKGASAKRGVGSGPKFSTTRQGRVKRRRKTRHNSVSTVVPVVVPS